MPPGRRARSARRHRDHRRAPPTANPSTYRTRVPACPHFTEVARATARTIRDSLVPRFLRWSARARGQHSPPPAMAELTIESLDQEGRGIAHGDGKVIFV